MVLVNGGMISVDTLLPSTDCVIEAWRPSIRGAEAIARSIFGLDNRWGKLSVTIYPEDWVNEVDMYNFDMSLAPGRTYKYYQHTPIFHFGFGLSYSSFEMSCRQEERLKLVCDISLVDGPDGDEVLQFYHIASEEIRARVDHPVPNKSLIEFERVHVV